jgi:hypothetical protein
MVRKTLLVLGLWTVGVSCGWAQSTKLALLLPNLYGPNGLTVDSEAKLPDGSTHSGHFNSAFQAEFTQFNIALAGQIAAIPLPSPASGFTYSFDSTLGVFKRSTESFGPILAERPETLGKRKFSFGLSYQHFKFDSIEGVPLSAVPAVFTHDDFQLGGGRSDVVTTLNSIDVSVDQTVAFLSYGLGSRLDVSVAVPIVAVNLAASSAASIQRIGTTNPAIHFYGAGHGDYGTSTVYSPPAGHASGIGDMVVRLKGNPLLNETAGLAIGVDVRLPTGDEMNLLGIGAAGVKPFAVFALSLGRFSPHANVAYQYNGKSVLAGDVATGRKAHMPDQFTWALGADLAAGKRLTLAVDFLGTRVVDSPRLVRQTFTAANGATFPQIGFVHQSYNLANGSAGAKVNLFRQLLLDVNVLFKLNDAGLRDKVTPLVGIEYAF